MRTESGIRRVIVAVLDGLRPDAIERFDLSHIQRLARQGASCLSATTVSPSITTAAVTSLLTGVSPRTHGITSDRVFLPKVPAHIVGVPELLARHGYPSSAFMGEVPPIFRGIAGRIGRRFGFGTVRLSGATATDILLAARTTLRTQRRGLIYLHWPDADRAGHTEGWMSDAYGDACMWLDGAMGMLASLTGIASDRHTLLIAVADHGGGGASAREHESDHAMDRTIPLILAGGAVGTMSLSHGTLLDVAPTILHALDVGIPASCEGRPLTEAFAATPASAVA